MNKPCRLKERGNEPHGANSPELPSTFHDKNLKTMRKKISDKIALFRTAGCRRRRRRR